MGRTRFDTRQSLNITIVMLPGAVYIYVRRTSSPPRSPHRGHSSLRSADAVARVAVSKHRPSNPRPRHLHEFHRAPTNDKGRKTSAREFISRPLCRRSVTDRSCLGLPPPHGIPRHHLPIQFTYKLLRVDISKNGRLRIENKHTTLREGLGEARVQNIDGKTNRGKFMCVLQVIRDHPP